MSIANKLKDHSWKEIRQARIVDMVQLAREQNIVLVSYEGPLSVCPTCGLRISDKWTHISDPSGVGCHGFLTKEVREFHQNVGRNR